MIRSILLIFLSLFIICESKSQIMDRMNGTEWLLQVNSGKFVLLKFKDGNTRIFKYKRQDSLLLNPVPRQNDSLDPVPVYRAADAATEWKTFGTSDHNCIILRISENDTLVGKMDSNGNMELRHPAYPGVRGLMIPLADKEKLLSMKPLNTITWPELKSILLEYLDTFCSIEKIAADSKLESHELWDMHLAALFYSHGYFMKPKSLTSVMLHFENERNTDPDIKDRWQEPCPE